jgi:hypothetical protein
MIPPGTEVQQLRPLPVHPADYRVGLTPARAFQVLLGRAPAEVADMLDELMSALDADPSEIPADPASE